MGDGDRATAPAVRGDVAAGFEPVRVAFAENFSSRGEVGASVHVLWRGAPVVDLWGGLADPATGTPFHADSLVNFYSAGKPLVALLVLRAVDEGLIGLDDPIICVWPEFAPRATERATIRHALCHRAGVPAIREPLTDDDLFSFSTMADAVGATAPWFEPSTRHVYHTNTYGHLLGEIARRLYGASPGAQLRALAAPLAADVHVGVADADLARCATIDLDVTHSPARGPTDSADPDTVMVRQSYFNPPGYSSFGVVNTAEWRRAEIPSTNGHGTARGLARMYAALLEPDRVISAGLRDEATRPQSTGPCPVLGDVVTFGLGFVPTSVRRPFGPHSRSFGHYGTGGALGFADPDRGLALGYVMNHVIPRWQSTRNRAIVDALYACAPVATS